MRTFHIPTQIKDEELIMGGKVSLRQMILAIVGLSIAGGLGFKMPGPIPIRIILALIVLAFFTFLILAKIHGMTADKFLWHYLKFRDSEKTYW